jgi:hypothetical protein
MAAADVVAASGNRLERGTAAARPRDQGIDRSAGELAVADEPPSSLDSDRRSAFIQSSLRECAREQAALMFVSHDASLTPLFDRAIQSTDLNWARVRSAGTQSDEKGVA